MAVRSLALGHNLKPGAFVTGDSPTAVESARRALARFELAAIRQRHAARLRLGLRDEELTALLYLRERPRLAQRDLVAISTLSRSGVGAMVHRLEEAGLIERVPAPGDRRVRLLQLSDQGSRDLRKACGACDAEVERLLRERPPEELDALSRLLSSVVEATEKDAGVPNEPEPVAANRDWRRWS